MVRARADMRKLERFSRMRRVVPMLMEAMRLMAGLRAQQHLG